MPNHQQSESSESATVAPRLAIDGVDRQNKTVLRIQVEGGVIAYKGSAEGDKALVRLQFYGASGKLVFVLPVIPGTFSSKDDTGHDWVELSGWLRSFVPHEVGDPIGAVRFRFQVSPAPARGKAVVLFSQFSINHISYPDSIPCDAEDLSRVVLSNQDPKGFDEYKYMTLIGFLAQGPPGPWEWRARFVTLQESENFTPHAILALELSCEYPVDSKHTLRPFGLEFKREELPQKQSTAGFPTGLTRILQRLPVESQWIQDGLTRQWLVSFGIPQSAVLRWWNDQVTSPVTASLQTIQQGRPLSTVPNLSAHSKSAADKTPLWEARFTFHDEYQQKDLDKAVFTPTPTSGPVARQISIVPRSIRPAADKAVAIACTFSRMRDLNGSEFQSFVLVSPPRQRSEIWIKNNEIEDAPQIRFCIDQASTATTQSILLRMGSLDLSLAQILEPPTEVSAAKPAGVREFLVAIELAIASGNFQFRKIAYRSTYLELRVSAISTGSQDDLPGAGAVSSFEAAEGNQTQQAAALLTKPRPLIISIESPPASDGVYFIRLQEIIQQGSSQTVWMRLRQAKALDSGKFTALVLDGTPFNVALVSAGALNSDDFDETTALATWTNQDSAWQFRNKGVGFDLLFPPQGMGEAMHRRLEDQDVIPNQPIDFRLTPPSAVFVRTGDLQRRFTEVPWNLRRLLGIPGYVSGAAADKAVFEIFYGLSGSFAVGGLRLSELFARRGSFAEPLATQPPWIGNKPLVNAYTALQQHFTELLHVLQTRLAVFELWSPLRELSAGAGSGAPLSLDQADSLSFRQRPTARLRYPIPGQKPERVAGQADEFQDKDGSLYKDGLAGGWAWGFESQNILTAVRSKRDSVSATLTGFYLSALGGWGSQKASYDRGLSTIHAKVEMARTSTINIERIGRINVFWNKAKHVIVYERTVCASRQFYLEQYPLTGNPVLRKVEEYIELIEDERRFPDKPVSELSRGFVLGLRFTGGKPPRIHVNSKWGQDVGKTGWKIPLWLRGAVPADIYPKPTAYILSAGASSTDQVPIAIADPEKLYFYTSTEQSLNPDPNTWPEVEGVDYQVMPRTSLEQPVKVDDIQHANDPRLVAAPSFIPPGGSAFTFSLEPSAAPANIVVGRAAEAVNAIPRSLTLMRGYRLAGASNFPISDPGSKAAYDVALIHDHISAVVAPLLHSPKDAVTAVKDAQAAFLDLKKAADDLKPPSLGAVCQMLADRLDAQAQTFEKEIRLGIVSALHQLQASFDATLEKAFQEAGQDIGLLKQILLSNLSGILDGDDGLRALILRSRGSIQELRGNLEAIPTVLESAISDLAFALHDAEATLTDLPDDASFPAAAAKIVGQFQRNWERLLLGSSATFPVQEALRAWLGPQVDAISHAIKGAFAELFDTCQKLKTDVKKDLLSGLIALLGELNDSLTTPRELLEALLDAIDAVLEKGQSQVLDQPLSDLRGKIETLIQDIQAGATPEEFRKKLTQNADVFFATLEGQIDAVLPLWRSDLRDQASTLCKQLLPDPAELLKQLKDVFRPDDLKFLDGLKDLTPDVRDRIEALLNRWKPALDGFESRLRLSIPSITWPTLEAPVLDGAFRLFRAFGDVPKLPNLDFSLPQLSYHFKFDNFNIPAIDLSPVLTSANRLADNVLGGFHLQLPSIQLLDRFVPPKLPDFEFSNLFPSLAGLKLENLFRSFPTPPNAPDGIKVTHGSDAASRSAWMQADIDFASAAPAHIFDLAGISLTLNSGRITAKSRIDATLGESPRQRTSGEIRGDWFIKAGSFAVVNIKSSTLRFDEEGRIHFDVSPAQVQMQPPLDFLARLLEPFQSSKDGFKVAITAEGVRTSLVLPIPNIQAGSFGIANLTLGFLFEILILPKFMIRTALQLGKRDRPFTITVFILGGAGSVQLAVSYLPEKGVFTTSLSVAIYASASLAISLGPISGGVYAYAGVEVDYACSSTGASNLSITLRILFMGEVCLLGFLSVGLGMSLEAEYRGGTNLIGRGSVNYSIKIGWFLTIEVHASVQYEFGSGQSSSTQDQQISGAAADYAGMF
jgi:hypothetical protein